MARRATAFVFVVTLVVGCGGGGSKGDGAVGPGTGGGAPGAGGTGGSAGGAAGATGSGGTSGGLPACAIAARPSDPVGTNSSCNTITFGGDWVTPEIVVATDGGIALDGGAVDPAGGTILDGDYQLVRIRSTVAQNPIRRAIRLFDGGTFIEWLNDNQSPNADGGVTEARFNTSQQPTHPAVFMLTLTCADSGVSASSQYAYTAMGDELVMFAYLGSGVTLVNTYRRTCAR